VKKVTKNTGGNLTPAALGGQLQINRNDTVSTLQESVAKLHAQNQMLARQIRNITKMGGVDKYELMQIRKTGERGLVQTSQMNHDYSNGGKMYEVSII
jgi:hypothetical protein